LDSMLTELELMAKKEDWSKGISLYARTKDKPFAVAQPVSFVSQPAGYKIEPMLCMSYTEAQKLMDQLWDCGLRPSEGSGSAGALAATERHLKDMQRIVFSNLESK
jgi:hypothetical protein